MSILHTTSRKYDERADVRFSTADVSAVSRMPWLDGA